MLCTIHLPSAIAHLLGADQVSVEASTIAGALAAAYVKHPALENLINDETGSFREHVLCFHNTASGSTNTRWLPDLSAPLQPGDSLLIMQAVTGG